MDFRGHKRGEFSPYHDDSGFLDFLDDDAQRFTTNAALVFALHVGLAFALSGSFIVPDLKPPPPPESVTVEIVTFDPVPPEPEPEPEPVIVETPPVAPPPAPTPKPQPKPQVRPEPVPPPPPPVVEPEPEPEPVITPPPPPEILAQPEPEPELESPEPLPDPVEPDPLPEPVVEAEPIVEIFEPLPEPIEPEPIIETLETEPEVVPETVELPVIVEPDPLPPTPGVIEAEPLPDIIEPEPLPPEVIIAPEPVPEPVTPEIMPTAPVVLASPDAPETRAEERRAVPQEQSDPFIDLIKRDRDTPLTGGGNEGPVGSVANPPGGGTVIGRTNPGTGGWTLAPQPAGPGKAYEGLNLDIRCREQGRTHADCPEYMRKNRGRAADGSESFDGMAGTGTDRGAVGLGRSIPSRASIGLPIGDNSVNSGGPSTNALDFQDTNFDREFLNKPLDVERDAPRRMRDLLSPGQSTTQPDWTLSPPTEPEDSDDDLDWVLDKLPE